jgi:F-type H+-transporting ATPase subunit b
MSELQTTESVGHLPAQEHSELTFLGLDPGGWVALAMLAVFALLIWKKVPGAISRALDDKIALIRDQLVEAESLRKEAEALKAEYEKKAKSVDKDRKALMERAKHEADEIVAKAKTDAEALIARRARMAEDKIAAEERAAVEQLRSAAADAAAKAAARLIAERHDAASDAQLVDRAIKEIAGR